MNSNRRGFTLVELLVVIGILAVLSAFVFPAIRRAMIKGKITETKTNIMSLATAIKGYYTDFNAYPDLDRSSSNQPYVSNATDAGQPERDNDMVMRLLTGRYYDPSDQNVPWKEDAIITTNKRWNGPYIELNESEAYMTGNDLARRVEHGATGFYDGYTDPSDRAAYVDRWKNGIRHTYFLFKFPEPWRLAGDPNNPMARPLFNRESFDIYSAGPDGKCWYYNLHKSNYSVDGYETREHDGDVINKDNIGNWD